jgi:CBS-domain-containing membrane protein
MRTASKPLLSLTAADLMTTTVVAIPQAMSLRGAAHLFGQSHISGAPVVNDEGRCIGVLSATDFVSWADKGEAAARRRQPATGYPHSEWQLIEPELLPHEEVSEYMTADPVIVPPGTSIGELARKMTDAHIHRVIVVDSHGRPVGIVSSTDILAALARAAH